jgi:type I restriction enzyme M protein
MEGNSKQLKNLFGKAARLLQQDCPQMAADLCLDLTGLIFLRVTCDRYDSLSALPEGCSTGAAIREAISYMESSNNVLPGVLPVDYIKYRDDVLSEVLELFSNITVQDLEGDTLGAVYESYLYRNAKTITDNSGVVFTPDSMVCLMVSILEPDQGILLDPACGSGRMFLHSAKYAGSALTFYGQELMETTARLCIMNLMLHGLNYKIAYGSEGNTLYRDAYALEGQCDFVLSNPPFNLKNVNTGAVRQAGRFPFGLPSTAEKEKISNANYLWISYCYAYLNTHGRAGVVLPSTVTDAKGEPCRIRRELVETGHVEVMLSAGSRFFQNHNLDSTLWFFNKGRPVEAQNTTLLIDARDYSTKTGRTRRGWSPWQVKNLTAIVWLYRGEIEKYQALLDEYKQELRKAAAELFISMPAENISFTEMQKNLRPRLEEIKGVNKNKVTQALHIASEATWLYERFGEGEYRDIPGLCRRVSRAEIEEQEYSLNPAAYVGLASHHSSCIDLPEDDAARGCWQEIRLGDIADMRDGLSFKMDAYGKGVSIIKVSDFQNRTHPDYTTLAQVQEKYVKPEDHLLNGDIVIVRSNGNAELVGRCMLIQNAPSSLTFSHHCIRLRLRNPDQYDPRFFAYLLKTKAFRQAMTSLAKDGGAKHISQNSLRNYMVRIPDLNRQREIASVLRDYDSKIEHNEQQIQLLVQTASQVYQEWFQQLRIPGFARHDIRREDWSNLPLGELLDLHFDVKSAGTKPGEIPLYSSKGILRYVDAQSLQGEHILIPRKGNLRNVMLVNGRFRTNDTLFYGFPRTPNIAKYLYFFLCNYGVEKLDSGLDKPQIRLGRLKNVMVPIPGAALLSQFERIETDYYQSISKLEASIRSLEHNRDAMIEKLIGRYSNTEF